MMDQFERTAWEIRPRRVSDLMKAPLLDLDEAAEVLKISRASLEGIMRSEDTLKPVCARIGRRVLFRPDDLYAYAQTLAA